MDYALGDALVDAPGDALGDVLRVFCARGDASAVCEMVARGAFHRTKASHGFLAVQKGGSQSFKVVALHDPPPRVYPHYETGTTLSAGVFRSMTGSSMSSSCGGSSGQAVVFDLKYKGQTCAFFVLHNDTKSTSETLKRKLHPLVPLVASTVIGAAQASEQLERNHDTLLATLSHEMRTPLNGIVGMTRLLKELPKLDEEEYHWASIAYSCAVQLVEIVSDLMDYSRLGAGRVKITREPVRLQTLLEDSHNVVQARADECGVRTEYSAEDPSLLHRIVTVDAKRTRQVLINLLSNAIKFSKRNQKVVTTASLTVLPSEQGHNLTHLLHVAVRDSGPGIAPQDIEELFEPSYRNRNHGQTSQASGMGIGLSICKNLVELMQGRIAVESSVVGRGTVMGFSIPCGLAADFSNSTNDDCATLANKHALLVMEDENARPRYFDALLKLRMKPFGCATTREAEVYVRSDFNFDVVLLGGSDSDAGFQSLITLFRNKGVPVISVSSHVSGCDGVDGLGASIVQALGPKTNAATRAKPNTAWGSRRVYDDLRILVVEDTPHNLKVITTTLQYSLGYDPRTIDTAIDGMEAVDKCAKKSYDIVLMDLHMPVMDGVAATRLIFDNCRKMHRRLPVIVPVTAYVSEEDEERCKEAGMRGFITKPVGEHVLERTLSVVRRERAPKTS